MPAFNIAAHLKTAQPFKAAREGKAMRAATKYQELVNEGLQRKIDLAPELEAFERRRAERDEGIAQRKEYLDKLRGYDEILQNIDNEEEWERSRKATSSLRRIHPMLSEQALKDFYLTATEEEIKALERIEAKHK